jgi:hypothetical protein
MSQDSISSPYFITSEAIVQAWNEERGLGF